MKIKLPKKINYRLGLNILLVVVIALELYLVYTYLYQNINPQPQAVPSNNIIRINRTSFSQLSQFIIDQEKFVAENPDLKNIFPFNLNH